MKRLSAMLIGCLLVLYSPALKAGNGSFLITKSAYLHSNPYKEDDKVLTRKRAAYNVVGIISLDSSLMFEIAAPLSDRPTGGEGYIAETYEDLRALSSKNIKKVNVYPIVPQNKKDLSASIKIPFETLSFAGADKTSPAFPEITWRAVNYKTVLPERRWIPEWAGIYRPDKDAKWLNNVYQTLLRSSYGKNVRLKILMGLTEIGFTKEQVTLTLGHPLKKTSFEDIKPDGKQATDKEKESDNKEKIQDPAAENQWIYKTQKIIFTGGRVSRIL